MSVEDDPCAEGCQYAKDVAMPEYSCADGCMYEKAKAEALPATDAHDLKWAIDRLYKIEAAFTEEDTATSRNDAKAILMVLEEMPERPADSRDRRGSPSAGA
jgi:hypothetical protein